MCAERMLFQCQLSQYIINCPKGFFIDIFPERPPQLLNRQALCWCFCSFSILISLNELYPSQNVLIAERNVASNSCYSSQTDRWSQLSSINIELYRLILNLNVESYSKFCTTFNYCRMYMLLANLFD